MASDSDVTFEGWDLQEVGVSQSGHLVFTRRREDAGIWAVRLSDDLRTTGDPARILAGSFVGISLGEGPNLLTIAKAGVGT